MIRYIEQLTFFFFSNVVKNVEVLIAPEGRLEKLYLLLTLDLFAFRVCSGPLVAVCLVEFCHFINSLLVLNLDLELELELMKHF